MRLAFICDCVLTGEKVRYMLAKYHVLVDNFAPLKLHTLIKMMYCMYKANVAVFFTKLSQFSTNIFHTSFLACEINVDYFKCAIVCKNFIVQTFQCTWWCFKLEQDRKAYIFWGYL